MLDVSVFQVDVRRQASKMLSDTVREGWQLLVESKVETSIERISNKTHR